MAASSTTAGEGEQQTGKSEGIVIRPFNPAADSWDEVSISRICEITAPPDLRAVLTPPPSAPLAPYLWAIPYVRLEPETCFVLDASGVSSADADVTRTSNMVPSSCVGYVMCAPSTAEFVTKFEKSYLPSLPGTWAAPPPPALPWSGDTLGGGMLQALHAPAAMLHSEFPELLEDPEDGAGR
ncbi:hypothetical protein V497_04740 [Pseudogymnoascus sp. VKM F-4516 (FW-969)]|nr:hypothetical protein V497_04740 [Pseudogymnoascus sp. VKM F-4516 (FW-969)]